MNAIDARKKLGQRVRGLRKKRGLSQEQFALDTGFGRSFTSCIERGTKDIRLSTLVKLADAFGITIKQLFH
jgi:transcriptional regulator with XRE-family HTH domain